MSERIKELELSTAAMLMVDIIILGWTVSASHLIIDIEYQTQIEE